MRTNTIDINADFTCKHCGGFVSALRAVSGMFNRNHCSHCLYSRHVDLFTPGDRLCACKSLMAPVGLTLKKCRDKYGNEPQGELMLIHRCTACGALSINRISADDNPDELMAVFTHSQMLDPSFERLCELEGIQLLRQDESDLLGARLYGMAVNVT